MTCPGRQNKCLPSCPRTGEVQLWGRWSPLCILLLMTEGSGSEFTYCTNAVPNQATKTKLCGFHVILQNKHQHCPDGNCDPHLPFQMLAISLGCDADSNIKNLCTYVLGKSNRWDSIPSCLMPILSLILGFNSDKNITFVCTWWIWHHYLVCSKNKINHSIRIGWTVPLFV